MQPMLPHGLNSWEAWPDKKDHRQPKTKSIWLVYSSILNYKTHRYNTHTQQTKTVSFNLGPHLGQSYFVCQKTTRTVLKLTSTWSRPNPKRKGTKDKGQRTVRAYRTKGEPFFGCWFCREPGISQKTTWGCNGGLW